MSSPKLRWERTQSKYDPLPRFDATCEFGSYRIESNGRGYDLKFKPLGNTTWVTRGASQSYDTLKKSADYGYMLTVQAAKTGGLKK